MNKSKTFLKKRIIPVILYSNYEIVKSLKFKDYRLFGNLEQTISVFNSRNVDEIIILDIDASKKKISINTEVLKILSQESIMPLTYGGGIKSLKDIEVCLKNGCDKVSINTKFLDDIKFAKESSSTFGSQCIVAAVDYIKSEKDFFIFLHSKYKKIDQNIYEYLQELQYKGVGEIMLNSVDYDGVMNGYETALFNKVKDAIKIPMILNGGCVNLEHIYDIMNLKVSALGMGSIFFYEEINF